MSNSFEKLFKEDYAVLFKSINSITVNDPVMKDAFDKFCDILCSILDEEVSSSDNIDLVSLTIPVFLLTNTK